MKERERTMVRFLAEFIVTVLATNNFVHAGVGVVKDGCE